MKQKDYVLLIVVVFFSGVVSLLVSNLIISPPDDRKEKVEVVEPITASFNPPDNKYFNENAINPTKIISIGEDANLKPFSNQ